jgi:hypothetical protein
MLNQILDFVSNQLMASSVVVGLVLEFSLRMFKSEKPIGILHAVAGGLKVVAQIFGKVAEFLDKVLPQKLK